MKIIEIISKLESMADAEAASGMARFGITANKVYGIKIPVLRNMAKEIGENHDIAKKLWEINSRETRILASMVEDPKIVSEKQADEWAADFDSWEVCDQCCMNLFGKTSFAYNKCYDWAKRDEEFVKRAGFVIMARLAVSDRKSENSKFIQFFPFIINEAYDNRNFVKKAVSWALRQIGKRNIELNQKAILIAKEILAQNTNNINSWAAKDALRELESKPVQKKIMLN